MSSIKNLGLKSLQGRRGACSPEILVVIVTGTVIKGYHGSTHHMQGNGQNLLFSQSLRTAS